MTTGTKAYQADRRIVETHAANRTFVYAIQPKEYAQNFADSSARQSSVNASLNVAAAIPEIGTSLAAYLSYVEQNQTLLEGIKRKPLLTGFIEDTNRFGWLLGPRFKIKNELKLGYEQVAEQESVQVTLEVPGWWKAIQLITTNQWLGDDGQAFSAASPKMVNKETIELRPDLESLTRAFLEAADITLAQPQIYPDFHPGTPGQAYTLTVGAPASFIIRGRNLWRNPQIFIGTQGITSAYNYQVLPDMGGLVVNLASVNQPPNIGTNSSTKVDLRVVTSDGESVLRDAVTIYSGTPQTTNLPPFVTLTNGYGVLGGTVTFTVNTNFAPPLAAYQLALGTTNSRAIPVGTNTAVVVNGMLTLAMPATSNPTWSNAAYATVDVLMSPTPGSLPVSVLIGGQQPFMVLTNTSQSQLLLVTPAPGTTGLSLTASTNFTLSLPTALDPNIFVNEWPGLNSAVQSPAGTTAFLSLRSASQGTVVVGSAPFKPGVTSFAFTLTNAAALKLTAFPTNCTANLLIPTATNPQWTIPVYPTLSVTNAP